MYIIVGLGNPGREYEQSRHNVGFMTLDILADKMGISAGKNLKKAIVAEGLLGGKKVLLAKPQTFMNLSGESVVGLMNWFKSEHHELIIVYDDVDLAPGKLRIREKGSAGTHNGMRNIIYILGYDDFPRVRVGVGKAAEGWDLASHVLAKPTGDDAKAIREAMEKAAEAIEMIVKGQIKDAQTRFN